MSDIATYLITTRETLSAAFARASNASEVITRELALAGHTLRLVFAQAAHHDAVMPALEHSATPSASNAPALTIHLWSDATFGLECGADPRARAHLAAGPDELDLHPDAHSSFIARDRGLAWAWCEDATRLPLHERAAPLRRLFQRWCSGHEGLQIVHAAAVGNARTAALLIGPGRSGKSTSALACLGPTSGLAYLGDDYCLVSRDQAGPRVHSLYRSGKLRPDMLAAMPMLGGHVVDAPPNAAAMLLCDGDLAARLALDLPLSLLLLPRVGSAKTHLTPATPHEALRAVAPSTLLQLRQGSSRTLANLSLLVRSLPSFWLELGAELAEVPGVIAAALAGDTKVNLGGI